MSELSKLLVIQDDNPPSIITLDPEDNVYEIDLDARTVEDIDTVIIESDHKSRVLYFKVARYFDNIDLTNMTCIIEYINAKNESYTYIVPFYDISTFEKERKICFSWEISQLAAKASGTIKYAITFYKVNEDATAILYRLNTKPQSFTIQSSIGFTIEDTRIEAQYVESYDTEFQTGKIYYTRTVENVVDADGNPKVDATGTEIKMITYSIASNYIEGTTYYEKVNLYDETIDNYFEVLVSAAKTAQEGALSWIILE